MASAWWVLPVMLGVLYYYRRPAIWDQCHFPDVDIQQPPSFTGVLAQNKLLQNAQKLFENDLIGPESALIEGDTMYVSVDTGVAQIIDQKLVKIIEYPGGRPLGIRRLTFDTLIFADGIKGLVTFNHKTEKFTTLIESGFLHDGKPMKFIDDLDVINSSKVIFSDASWLASEDDPSAAYVAAPDSGRVFSYDLETQKVELLMDHLHFSNGIQLFPDLESVLVSETFTATIWRHYISGPRKGESEVFSNNLPGLPDNLRISKDGKSFYVAFCVTRRPDAFNLLDFLMKHPSIRWFLFNLVPHSVHHFFMPPFKTEDYGLFVQINLEGQIIKSYHAPDGIFNHMSQITDAGDKLYISSFVNPYFAVVGK